MSDEAKRHMSSVYTFLQTGWLLGWERDIHLMSAGSNPAQAGRVKVAAR